MLRSTTVDRSRCPSWPCSAGGGRSTMAPRGKRRARPWLRGRSRTNTSPPPTTPSPDATTSSRNTDSRKPTTTTRHVALLHLNSVAFPFIRAAGNSCESLPVPVPVAGDTGCGAPFYTRGSPRRSPSRRGLATWPPTSTHTYGRTPPPPPHDPSRTSWRSEHTKVTLCAR